MRRGNSHGKEDKLGDSSYNWEAGDVILNWGAFGE